MNTKKRTNYFLFFLILLCSFSLFQTVEAQEITEKETRLEYARLLKNLKRYDDSKIQYQKLLDEEPDSINLKVELAEVFYYEKNYKQALAILEKIPPKDRSDQTSLLMAEIYRAIGEYSSSEVIYLEQLKKHPEDDQSRLKLAEQYSWQKKYDDSTRLYKELLAKYPNDTQLRRKFALVLMWMGKEKESAEEFEKTLK